MLVGYGALFANGYQPNPTMVVASQSLLIIAFDDTAEAPLPRIIERYLCDNPQLVVRPVLLSAFDWMTMGDRSLVVYQLMMTLGCFTTIKGTTCTICLHVEGDSLTT